MYRNLSTNKLLRRLLTLAAVAALITGTVASSGTALALTQSSFELDNDAIDGVATRKLGTLKSNTTVGAGTVVVCQPSNEPATTPFVIQIDAELLRVTAAANATGGGCSPKRSYTVERGYDITGYPTVATAHDGGSDVGLVTIETSDGADDDWDDVYAAIQADPNSTCLALGALECAWDDDPRASDTTYFDGGGSKDDLDIPSWGAAGNSVPPSDEILDAMAAKYVDGGDQILYFAADRWSTNGAKDFGFWFFHNEVTLDGAGGFDGEHQARTAGPDTIPGNDDDVRGDILILGTFTQGGAVASARVFEWVGTGGDATANGTVAGPIGSFGDCVPGIASDKGCITVNDTDILSPWAYTGAEADYSGAIRSGGFVEGAINLSDLGLDGCFSSFIAETRSSPQVDAQLKDFVLGEFEACGATIVTTPTDGSGDTIPAPTDPDEVPDSGDETPGGLSISTNGSIQVKDEAVVTVTGTNTFGGDVTFYLCFIGTDTTSSDTCNADEGTQIGDPKDVTGPSPATVLSDAAELTSAGRYCWRASYSGDASIDLDGDDDNGNENECFNVNPVRPTLTTQAVDSEGVASNTPVPFGQAVYDTADLTGTAPQPGDPVSGDPADVTVGDDADGTITFKLYGPLVDDPETTDVIEGCDTLATDFPAAGIVVDIDNGGDGTYGGPDSSPAVSFVPAAPGVYAWKAVYSGDLPNTLSASHNGDCDDPNEAVTVQQLQPTMDTAQSFIPNDSATVTVEAGAGDLDGTVTFYLWVDDSTCDAGVLADADATFGPFDVSDTDDAGDTSLTDTVGTQNTTAYGTTGTTFDWIAVFESDNGAHLDVTSGCGNENSSITIDNGVTQPET